MKTFIVCISSDIQPFCNMWNGILHRIKVPTRVPNGNFNRKWQMTHPHKPFLVTSIKIIVWCRSWSAFTISLFPVLNFFTLSTKVEVGRGTNGPARCNIHSLMVFNGTMILIITIVVLTIIIYYHRPCIIISHHPDLEDCIQIYCYVYFARNSKSDGFTLDQSD